MRLVLDTDVLVAGLRSATGASRILLRAVYAGAIQPLVSVATMFEYEAVLTRTDQLMAMGLSHVEVIAWLDIFVTLAEEVSPYYDHGGIVRDPNDDKFVTVALNGNAEAIVTFNIRDYVPRDGRVIGLGINVCRPGDILRRLSWRPPATSRFGSRLH